MFYILKHFWAHETHSPVVNISLQVSSDVAVHCDLGAP